MSVARRLSRARACAPAPAWSTRPRRSSNATASWRPASSTSPRPPRSRPAGSFYHYFDSKQQIFREVARAQEERLAAPADDPASGLGDATPWDRVRRANRLYLQRYRDEAAIMGVIEQVSRYDPQVNAARMATMKHFVGRAERAIRRLQRDGLVDRRIKPSMAADALGAMVARFAELWLVQGYRDYDFDDAVEQLTILWGNALGLEHPRGRTTT